MGGKGGMGGMGKGGMGGMGMGMGMSGGPPAKRMRTEQVSSGDAMKDKLVMQVKDYQRSGEEQKQTWWSFCDEAMGGIRDPAKHEKNVLQQFLRSQGEM